MKRIMMLLVAGTLLVPAFVHAQVVRDTIPENDGFGRSITPFAIQSIPEATSGFRVPVNTITAYGNHFNQWDDIYCTSYNPPGAYHPGVDLNSAGSCDDDRGTDILAVANGRVVYVDVSDWGGMVIQHNWKGETWYSQYGHINSPLVAVGDNVTKGQHIAEMSDVGTTCVHLHWEIREADHPNPTVGDYWTCSVLRSSTSVANYYEDPEAFVASHGSYSDYRATKTGQSTSVTPWLPAGSAYTLWVDYRNDGATTWKNSGSVSGGYVELRSVDGGCSLYDSFCAYDAATWINRQGIGPALQASVPTGGTARFQFVARAANATGECVQWVAPWASGQCMDGWGGVNFTIRTDATPPDPFTASVTPSTNNVNSYSFSWSASSDGNSGLKGYYWSVNGGGETFTTSTTLPTGAYATVQGTNTFNVRAVDNAGAAGNSTSAAPVYFTLTSSPCPGREIPHTCVPSTTCYPA